MNFKELLKDTDHTFTVNEKAPEWLYKALKTGEVLLFARKDKTKWKVIMDYDWFVNNLLKGGNNDVITCPYCGKIINKSTL